jgi:hypothetical protein
MWEKQNGDGFSLKLLGTEKSTARAVARAKTQRREEKRVGIKNNTYGT